MPDFASRLAEFFFARRPHGVAAAYLFGSRVRGTAHVDSDADVGLVFSQAVVQDAGARARIAEGVGTQLVSALHVNSVDVLSLNDAHPELAASVFIEGERVFCGDAESDHVGARTASLRNADLQPFLTRTRRLKLAALSRAPKRMTFLVERLAELSRHLAHLRMLRSRVAEPSQLRTDLSLHNDVLYSLRYVCQAVIDIAGEPIERFVRVVSKLEAEGT